MSEKQRAKVEEQDPTFWRDVIGQREQLAERRDRLAKLLEDSASTDQQIVDQIERSIALGNEIERRVTKHLLVLRKHLTPEQQKKLFGLAASGVRERMSWCDQRRGGREGPGRGQRGFRGGRGRDGERGQGFGGQGRGHRGPPSTTQCCPHDADLGAQGGDRNGEAGRRPARSGDRARGRGRGYPQQGENR